MIELKVVVSELDINGVAIEITKSKVADIKTKVTDADAVITERTKPRK